ncbi:TonB-dependent receptor [bacterium]|nr:TonB-dependent receptor [bacterium]
MKPFWFRETITIILILVMADLLNAQARPDSPAGVTGITLSGTVLDSMNRAPLEYATIILISQKDNQQITGTVTNHIGRFELSKLRPGKYTVKVDFIGYNSTRLTDIELTPRRPETDIGQILLEPAVLESEGVEVSAEKPVFEYKIDKKVINVSQQPTVISGTAVDVLENVPSVTTDIEGNVELRGSSNFTVLIDNRPTVLESNDALQQIPASTIENIEIITNPSAKFDPEGTAGIINIITKKKQRSGITGIANINLSLENRRNGGDILLNRRTEKFNFFLGADYNKRSFPRDIEMERITYGDTVYNINATGTGEWGGTGYGIRGGLDYSVTDQDLLTLSFRAGGRDRGGDSENHYEEWSEPGDTVNYYTSMDERNRKGNFYSLSLDYKHDFQKKGHELLGHFNISKRSGDEESKNKLLNIADEITYAQHFTEKGPSQRIRWNLDYTLPLRENDKFQTGIQSRLNDSEDETERYDYNLETRVYELQSLYSHFVEYQDNFHAAYAMYAAEIGPLGIQGGLRTEYTDRNITLTKTQETYIIDRWDFFPTAHFSYTISKGQQMMASYTRRIDRPRGWELEPFKTWMDAYNVRQGNPDLKPEYIDSYELGAQTFWGKNLISLEGYYRVTHNKVERIQSSYGTNVTMQTIENVGKDYTLGAELMTNVDLIKWWNVNLMGTLYHYKVEGTLFGSSFSRDSHNWRLRFNNTLKLSGNTRLQLTGMYNSPSVSSQGRREDFYLVNFGLKQSFFNRTLSATFQVRDLLKTGKWEFSTETPNFDSHNIFKRSPMVMLTLTYNINNYKQERNRQLDQNGGEENGNGGEMQGGGEEY